MKVTGATGTAPTAAMASTIWSTSLREMVGISGIVTSSCDETTKVVGGTSLTATDALTGNLGSVRGAARGADLAREVPQDSRSAARDWSARCAGSWRSWRAR